MSRLAGQRILLTRAAADNAGWAEELRALGAVPLEHPCLTQEVLLRAAADVQDGLERAAWVALCSRHAVRALAELSPGRLPGSAKLACVGPITKAETERVLGAAVELVAPEGSARSLAQALLERVEDGELVFVPGAERGRDELAEEFRAAGRELERLPVYRTRSVDPTERGAPPPVDAIFFASPSAVEAFAQGPAPRADVRLISLGPSTSEAVRAAGWTVAAESRTRDLGGMVEALERASSPGDLPHGT